MSLSIITEMQRKTAMRYIIYPSNSWRLMTPNVARDRSYWNISCGVGESVNDMTTLEKDLRISRMSPAGLFIVAPNWEQPKCPSVEEWINRLWYMHTGPQKKKKKNLLTHTTAWISKTSRWERGASPESMHFMILFPWNSRTGQTNLWWKKCRLVVASGRWQWGWGWLRRGRREYSGGDGDVLELDSSGCICQNFSIGTLEIWTFHYKFYPQEPPLINIKLWLMTRVLKYMVEGVHPCLWLP